MKTILVADDEVKFRSLIQAKLEKAGYRVETTENGQQAWERLQQGGIDLLITDIIMAEMDGFELIELVRTNKGGLAALPILVIDIRPNPSEPQPPAPPQEQDWSDYWLGKPFNPMELISILNHRFRS